MKSLALLLLSFLIIPGTAFGDDCARRLRPDFASFVEKTLDRGLIKLEQVELLARAQRPYNPIRHLLAELEATHFVEIFDGFLSMDDATWEKEKVKLLALVAARRKDAKIDLVAREATAHVLAPEVVATLPSTYKGLPYLSAKDGEVYYLILENGRLKVKKLFSSETVWEDDQDFLREVSDADLRINESGEPEMMYLRYFRYFDRVSGYFTHKSCYKTITVNLRTGNAQSKLKWLDYRERLKFLEKWKSWGQHGNWIYSYEGKWPEVSKIRVFDRRQGDSSGFDVQLNKKTLWASHVYEAAGGEIYSVTLTDDLAAGGRRLRVVARSRAEAPLVSHIVPDEKSRVLVFEDRGDLYVVVDQFNGSTFFYRPLASSEPVELDMSAYRDSYLEMIRAKDGQVYLQGTKGDTSFILSLTRVSR